MMKRSFLIFLLGLFTIVVNAQSLKIYAQDGEDYIYLGNFSSPYDSNSIFNDYGTYGNQYNNKSIWNEYGKFGSEYNSLSPWNEYSSNPPVLVNSDNKVVGYFTANIALCPKELAPMMKYIKKNFLEVAKNPSKVYELFFK